VKAEMDDSDDEESNSSDEDTDTADTDDDELFRKNYIERGTLYLHCEITLCSGGFLKKLTRRPIFLKLTCIAYH
jgi:hypothetical protein